MEWCLQKLVTWFSALTCIILILSSPWKDVPEEVEINLLKVLIQRNQNVGNNFYQMMKININYKTDFKCEANKFNSFTFNKSEPFANLWRGSFPFTYNRWQKYKFSKRFGIKVFKRENRYSCYPVFHVCRTKRLKKRAHKNSWFRYFLLFVCTTLKLNCKV